MAESQEPRLARAILRFLLAADEKEFILGDLAEDFHDLAERSSVTVARRWYVRQVIATLADRTLRRPTSYEAWRREVRFACRRLVRSPAYSTTTVGTLGVAFGGVLAIATLADGVFSPLPMPESGALYAVWETHGPNQRSVAPANYIDWRMGASTFSGLAAHDTRGMSVTIDGIATRERLAAVSGNFFEVLAVQAVLGRSFDPTFNPAFSERVAVLSHEAWTERFDGRPDAIGRSMILNDLTHEIIGVMPPDLNYPDAGLFGWVRSPNEVPEIRGFPGDVTRMRDAWFVQVVGRLTPGTGIEAARTEMNALASRLSEEYPETNGDAGVLLVSLLEQSTAGFGSTLIALALAVGLILLGATVNVMQLTLARAESRRHDSAVRVAIGASGTELRRGAIVEGWLIGLSSSVLSLGVAHLAVGIGVAHLGPAIPRAGELTLTLGISTIAILMGIAAGTLLGWTAYRSNIRSGAIAARAGRDFRVGRDRFLVATQVAIAITVVATASLLGRSLAGLARVELGFDPEHLSTIRIAIPDASARSYPERIAMYARISETVGRLPGIVSVGLGADTPLSMGTRASVRVENTAPTNDPPDSGWQPVDVDYFGALGMTLLRGRTFSDSDGAADQDVAIVNEAFIRSVLSGREALGARVTMGLDGHDRPLTIVGVVADTRTLGPAAEPGAVLYRPLAQTSDFSANAIFLVARSTPGSGTTVETLRRSVRQLEPGLPIYGEAEGTDLVRPFRASQSMLLTVMTVFATTALLVGMVGVYGVGMHSVRRRRGEIGVRMALGATSNKITGEIVSGGVRSAATGVVPGVLLTIALGRAIEGVLFDVEPTDPATLGFVTTFVLMATACVLVPPARLAASVDPARSTKEP